jgi:hypothetical protein
MVYYLLHIESHSHQVTNRIPLTRTLGYDDVPCLWASRHHLRLVFSSYFMFTISKTKLSFVYIYCHRRIETNIQFDRLTVASFTKPCIQTDYMQHNLTNQEKVTYIRALNLRDGLPEENPETTFYNGAQFEASQIDDRLFLVTQYRFTHPLSDYPEEEQIALVAQYAADLAEANHPRACFIGYKGNHPAITIHTKEVNLQRYWILVQRTVFLHRAEPVISCDIIAPSTVTAPPNYPVSPDYRNTFRAPDNIYYTQPPDLRPPR